MPKISIIIPAYNEEKGIGKTLQGIPKEELKQMGYETQVIVVDNNCTDLTPFIAECLGAEVVVQPKQGYGLALKAGFDAATGDLVVTADADGTYPLERLPKLLEYFEKNQLDFLNTNRFEVMYSGSMSLKNKIGNRILTSALQLLFGLNIKDSQSGMWVLKREILNKLKVGGNGMPLCQELKIEACYYEKFKWGEVPIIYRERIGKPKLNPWRVGVDNLYHLVLKRVRR